MKLSSTHLRPKTVLKKPRRILVPLAILFFIFASGCATPYLKGITSKGNKVYLGSLSVQDSEAYQAFINTQASEIDRIHYLMKRLRENKDLEYYHDGAYYNWLEAYRGGMWLMRNRYKKDLDALSFIRDYVWRSETTGDPHLVRYPDGSVHVGYYILLNELNLLEATLKRKRRTKRPRT
jgi:hypothetical protein